MWHVMIESLHVCKGDWQLTMALQKKNNIQVVQQPGQ